MHVFYVCFLSFCIVLGGDIVVAHDKLQTHEIIVSVCEDKNTKLTDHNFTGINVCIAASG